MANIKSAKKRIGTNEKARMINKSKKSSMRTVMKSLEDNITKGNKEESTKLLSELSKKLDSGVTSGIVHKNYASRQKSRLAKKVNAL